MLRRVSLLLLLSSLLASALLARDGYLGVYASVVGGTVTVEDEHVGFAPKDALQISVSVANEEGGEELFLNGGIMGSLRLDLVVDGEPQHRDLTLSWAGSDQRYAFFGELPQEPSRAGVLEPDVGLKTELTLRRRDGSPFSAGRYVIRLHVEPQAVTFADGSSWVGRGGVGGTSFELRDEDSDEARLLALKIRARDATLEGLFREAAELWAEVIDLDAADEYGWSGLGVSLHHLGDHQGAVEWLGKVMPMIAEKGLNTTLPLLIAESYVVLGELEKAREALLLIVVEPDVASKLQELQLKVGRPATEK